MKKGESSTMGTVVSVILALALVSILLWGTTGTITGKFRDVNELSVNQCGNGLQQGQCFFSERCDGTGDWQTLGVTGVGCDKDSAAYCCFCKEAGTCFQGKLFFSMPRNGAALQFEETDDEHSDLVAVSGASVDDIEMLQTTTGIPNDIHFNIDYQPATGDEECELTISGGEVNGHSYGKFPCKPGERVLLTGNQRNDFRSIEDDNGNSPCTVKEDACQVTFRLLVNGAQKEGYEFDVYFER